MPTTLGRHRNSAATRPAKAFRAQRTCRHSRKGEDLEAQVVPANVHLAGNAVEERFLL